MKEKIPGAGPGIEYLHDSIRRSTHRNLGGRHSLCPSQGTRCLQLKFIFCFPRQETVRYSPATSFCADATSILIPGPMEEENAMLFT